MLSSLILARGEGAMDAAWLYHLLAIAALAFHSGVGALDSFTGTSQPPQGSVRARLGLFRRLRPTFAVTRERVTGSSTAVDPHNRLMER